MNALLQHPVVGADVVEAPLCFDADLYTRLAISGAFDEAGRVELLDGVILKMSPQAIPHMRAKSDIANRLRRAVDDLGLALRVDQEGSVRISSMSVPEPDILVWDGQATAGFVSGAAVSLLVEVADTTLAKDLVVKARLYAEAGIPEYWVADVNAGVIHRYTGNQDGAYADRMIFRSGERIDCRAVARLAIDVPQLG